MEYLKRISLRVYIRWRERGGWLSYAGAASAGVGDSQRYSRKSNEREPNEAILKGDIVGSLGRRTNSITSSGIEGGGGGWRESGTQRTKPGGRGGKRSAGCTWCSWQRERETETEPVYRASRLQERIGRNTTRPAFLRIARLRFHRITLSISSRTTPFLGPGPCSRQSAVSSRRSIFWVFNVSPCSGTKGGVGKG